MKINQLLASCYKGIAILLLLHSYATYAANGSCEGFEFPLQDDGKQINTSWPLRVLRQNAPVYDDANGHQNKSTFDFGQVLEAISISNSQISGRVQICKQGCMPGNNDGWMDRKDLLCEIYPLKNDGLERKAFIKTPPVPEINGSMRNIAGTNNFVTAYKCYEDSCEKNMSLSRFEMYFIYAESDNRYLLADKYNLLMSPPLVGWVDKDKIVPWNTTLQLRPREDVTHISAFPNLNQNRGNKDRGVQIDRTAGIELTGGNTWYKFPLHMPLLELTKEDTDYYNISAPGIGMNGFDVNKMDAETEVIAKLKHVDIFFLLDGTRSMQTSLNAAKTFVHKIVNELSKQHDYKETHFRFGFRVYRDNFKGTRWSGDESIGEGLALSGDCHARDNTSEQSQQNFNKKISKIKESDETSKEDSSHEEALFKGIKQAVRDMSNCPDRQKILFVIGDNGDNRKTVPKSVIDRLTNTFTHSVRLFFIQTPKQNNNNNYRHAYQRFENQGNTVLQRIYPAGSRYQDNFIKLRTRTEKDMMDKLAKIILKNVSNNASSSNINETILKLRAGQSVKSIIEAGMREGDMPILYWQLLKKDLCQSMGEQCNHPVDHRVIEAYIEVSDKLVEEIWMLSRDLDHWKSLLRALYINVQGKPFDEQKTKFTKVLKEEIVRILGEPILKGGEDTLLNIVNKKNSFPVRKHSPLMQYSVKEILNMQQCEFQRLINWVENIYNLLSRLTAQPTYKIEYSLSNFPDSQCPRVSNKGRNIQRLKLSEASKPLGPSNEYSYQHTLKGETIYSIPTNFLP